MTIPKSEFSLAVLINAAKSLELALSQPKNEFIRDSVIQRFEYTFELTWKTLKRYFESFQSLQEFNIPELFRTAARQGIIEKVDLWFEFHKARNATSHVYNEAVAEQVYQSAKGFLPEVKKLIKNLEKKIGATNPSK